MTRIADLLAKGRTYSFEFFPPKNDAEQATLVTTLRDLEPLGPSFVSVTYRGGAESRKRTFDLVTGMLRTTTLVPHGPPDLRGPHPARVGGDPRGLPVRRRGEPDGAGRGPAHGARGGTGRAASRLRVGRAGPCHRGLLGGSGGPAGLPSAVRRPCVGPGPSGREAVHGRLRHHPVLLRGGGVPRAGGRPRRPRGGQAGTARHHARHQPELDPPHGGHGRHAGD